MRSNASIISNGMLMPAPELPDVNAMMQTRTAGLENMYKIERQRAEDTRLEQERQSAAAAEAIAPAVASVFSDPSDAGLDAALALVPPQYQAAAKAQIDQLRAIPDVNKRKNVIRAALAQDEIGRALLTQLEPSAGARLQADLERERLSIERAKLAKGEAPPVGSFKLVPTDRGLVVFNERTGEYRLATAGEVAAATGEAGMPGPRMEAIPAPSDTAPISTEQPPQDNILRPPPKAGSTEQTQEERRRAASVRYTVRNADRVAEIIDKNPDAFGQGADEFLLSLLPFGAGEDFMAFVQDADRQQLNYRMTQIVATLLRLETGAAYTRPELATEAASFMQKYGDKPATARDKLDALQDRVSSAVGSTGRAWTAEDQAEYDAAIMALEAMKNKLYPVGGAGGGEVDISNPLLQD